MSDLEFGQESDYNDRYSPAMPSYDIPAPTSTHFGPKLVFPFERDEVSEALDQYINGMISFEEYDSIKERWWNAHLPAWNPFTVIIDLSVKVPKKRSWEEYNEDDVESNLQDNEGDEDDDYEDIRGDVHLATISRGAKLKPSIEQDEPKPLAKKPKVQKNAATSKATNDANASKSTKQGGWTEDEYTTTRDNIIAWRKKERDDKLKPLKDVNFWRKIAELNAAATKPCQRSFSACKNYWLRYGGTKEFIDASSGRKNEKLKATSVQKPKVNSTENESGKQKQK
ncbi:hypothetical protein EG329_009803 [Mollisiaceae sp. DMI_Dod_QoI]|nr:hypothetical protein EG329_009803 [Helotiales sp. DMI_Dod_QoI]